MNTGNLFKTSASLIASSMALLAGGQSQAAVEARLNFVQPTATVSPSDAVEVWVRLSLAPTSDPLVLQGSSFPFTLSFLQQPLPSTANYYDPVLGRSVEAAFATYSFAALNTSYSHSGNFTLGFNQAGSAYNFSFWTSSQPGKPSMNFRRDFSLQPGESSDYLFGVFNPVNGQAPEGTYNFYTTSLFGYVQGADSAGHFLSARVFPDIASTCSSQQAACAFTRTVSAVPEPGTWLLMAVGALGVLARRSLRARPN